MVLVSLDPSKLIY